MTEGMDDVKQNSATAVHGKIVKLFNCSINVQSGDNNTASSSTKAVHIWVGVGLALILALGLAHFTSTPCWKVFPDINTPNDSANDDTKGTEDKMASQEPLVPVHSDTGGPVLQLPDHHIPISPQEQNKPSWKAVERVLTAVTPFIQEVVNYGGETFVCEARSPYVKRFQLHWKGKCTDQRTGLIGSCKGVKSPGTAVRHAAAKLIRDMAREKKYPEPSESEDMPTECEQ